MGRHQRRKQSRPDARFKDAAAAPAEPFQTLPDRTDDELGREMRILGATGKRGVVRLGDGSLQLFPELVPTFCKPGLARPGENCIGEIGRPESRELDQRGLAFAQRGVQAVSDVDLEVPDDLPAGLGRHIEGVLIPTTEQRL